jgi:hypothetical protein
VVSIFSTVFSQSSASSGSAAWENTGGMAHELTMLVEWRRLLHRWIVGLSLQVGHMVVKFWRSWVWVWKNCYMAGSICPSCGAGFERLLLHWRFIASWSTPDPDLVFTTRVLGTLF